MSEEEMRQLQLEAEDGCLADPSATIRLLAEIAYLRSAMRSAMEDKNANPDSMAPIGRALGYSKNDWGEWIVPE